MTSHLSWVLSSASDTNTHPLVGGVKGALLCPDKLVTQAMQAQLHWKKMHVDIIHAHKNYTAPLLLTMWLTASMAASVGTPMIFPSLT